MTWNERREERLYDQATWRPGPWQDEPDRIEWRHAGLPCLMVRSEVGNWCGYVAVPPGHPMHGKHYDDESVTVTAHGGLTFSDACEGRICHVPEPGEPDDVWWLGFDCAHAGDDWLLTYEPLPGWPSGTYRDVAYVRAEVERLAKQLHWAEDA